MPGLAIPDVTLITASANTMTAYMAAMRTHFNGVSTKFTLKANGHTDDAFTLVPAAVGEDWEMNFRRTTSLLASVLIDPLENITAPGTTGVAPTITDASEASPETTGVRSPLKVIGGGAEDVDFYVVELDDALFVLFMDPTPSTHTPRALHAGRVYIPYLTDGVNGDNYADGLGILGSIPRFTSPSSNGTDYWHSASTVADGNSRIRIHQTGWQGVGGTLSATYVGRINGIERIRPLQTIAANVDGNVDNILGFTRYIALRRIVQSPGTLLDAGVGKDAWVSLNYTGASTGFVIPWDRNLTPVF